LIQALRKDSGAEIDVYLPSDGRRGGNGGRAPPVKVDPGRALIQIRASDPEVLAKGKAMVEEAVGAYTQVELQVGDHVIPALLGKKGATIQRL